MSEHTDPFLAAAFAEAQQSLAGGGIPIGSVLVHADRIIGEMAHSPEPWAEDIGI